MSDPDVPLEAQAEIERAIAAVETEAARVGVDWGSFDTEVLSTLPTAVDDSAEQEEPTLGLDAHAMLNALRELPDGAGTAALLAALGVPQSGFEPAAT
jgi:hypothetical protein